MNYANRHDKPDVTDNLDMNQRKRATRSAIVLKPASNTLSITALKPRNAVLQAAALGQVKMGTAKHEKSKGAIRRAEKMALSKAATNNDH